jgi:predicted transcriptional regulator
VVDRGAVLKVVAEGGAVARSDVARWVRENGLSRIRARVYRERVGPVTVDDVAQRLRIPTADVLAAVRALAATGAIERCPFPVVGTGLWRAAGLGAGNG